MASRVLGFFLGVVFIALAIMPFLEQYINIEFVSNIIQTVYFFHMLGPLSTISLILMLMGIFCLQSSIRDTWPFYG
ncbi:MAG TPA: hypothetical protein VI790_02665 [Candidatus Nanoarchaeia archaeon]|nr:hypothetical protein [Candidatus Nanoarchaeia archaeon]